MINCFSDLSIFQPTFCQCRRVHRNHQFWTTIYHLLVYSSTRLQPKKSVPDFLDLTNLPVYSSTRLHWQKVVWKTERSEKQFIIYSSTCLPVYTRKKSVPDFLAAWPIQRLSPQVLHWSHLLFFWCVVSLSLTVLTFCEWSRIWGESDPPPLLTLVFSVFWCDLLVYSFTGLRAFFFKVRFFSFYSGSDASAYISSRNQHVETRLSCVITAEL